MLREHVAIKDVDLCDRRLGHEVKDINAGTAKSRNSDSLASELRVNNADASSARCRVDVFENTVGFFRWDSGIMRAVVCVSIFAASPVMRPM